MHPATPTRRRLAAALVCAAVLVQLPACGRAQSQPNDGGAGRIVQVLAAASLEDLLTGLAPVYERENPGVHLQLSFAGTQTLARQIDAGAQVDLFIAADPKALIDITIAPKSRRDWMDNRLVMVAPADSKLTFDQILHADGPVAIGMESSPIGDYTRLALRKLDVWDTLRPRAVQLTHVRAVLEQVAGGSAVAGIVYSTDAATMPDRLRVVRDLPLPDGVEVVYALGEYSQPGQQFAQWLVTSDAAKRAASQAGFSAAGTATTP